MVIYYIWVIDTLRACLRGRRIARPSRIALQAGEKAPACIRHFCTPPRREKAINGSVTYVTGLLPPPKSKWRKRHSS